MSPCWKLFEVILGAITRLWYQPIKLNFRLIDERQTHIANISSHHTAPHHIALVAFLNNNGKNCSNLFHCGETFMQQPFTAFYTFIHILRCVCVYICYYVSIASHYCRCYCSITANIALIVAFTWLLLKHFRNVYLWHRSIHTHTQTGHHRVVSRKMECMKNAVMAV